MKDFLILEGKSLEELTKDGLAKLNRQREEVDVEILEKSKAFFGLGNNTYKIKLTVKQEDENCDDFLNEIDEAVDTEYSYFTLDFKEDGVYLNVNHGYAKIRVTLKEVLNKLNKKGISSYDINAINLGLDNGGMEAVKIAPPQEQKLIDAEPLIELSQDETIAYLTLLPPDGGKDLAVNEGLKMVKEQVQYGLIPETVERVIENKLYNKRIIIAKGKKPLSGIDGRIQYKFKDLKKGLPEQLVDGSVDFRNLHLINNVKKGDLLAEIFPATEGEPGQTVSGEVIPQIKGKNITPKYGKNVGIDETNCKLVALTDGQVILEEEKVVVRENFEIKGDVDNATGNITFNGSIIVKGNVRTGFAVKATTDVIIEGVVEGAIIESEGNILLKRGVQGYHNGLLRAEGDIVARYIENCKINCNGNISSEAIMHSKTESGRSIKVTGKKGLIVGGICKATHEIVANTIGSTMETTTILEVGINPELKNRYESAKEELIHIENQVDKLSKSISLLNRLAKNDRLTEDKKNLLIKSLRAHQSLSEKSKYISENIIDLETQIELLSNGRIIVNNIIYPGVKVVIGNSVLFIKAEHTNCVICKDQGEIKIRPYNK